MRNHIFLLALSLTLFTRSTAQDECACEVAQQLRPEIANHFNSGKLDAAENMIRTFHDANTEACETFYLDGMAQVAISRKQFDNARIWLIAEQQVLRRLRCTKLDTRYHNTLARYYQETGQPDSVIFVSLQVIRLAGDDKNWYAQARAATNLASIFDQQRQQHKSLQYNRIALTAARQSKDTGILAAVLVRLADSYFENYELEKDRRFLDSVQVFAKEALVIGTGASNLMERSDAFNQLSRLALVNKNYDEALALADSALSLCPKSVHHFNLYIYYGYQRKAEALLAMNDFQQAGQMADSAYHYASLFNEQLTIAPLETMYRSQKELGNDSRALLAFEKLTRVRDSIFTIDKNVAINELEKKYNQAQNEKKIANLGVQKQRVLLIALSAIFGIGLIAFYFRQQFWRKRQQALETEQRLNRARINPHFFFNTLAGLQGLAMQPTEQLQLARSIAGFSRIMRATLENTFKEFVTLTEELGFVEEYVRLQQVRNPGRFELRITMSDDIDSDGCLIPAMLLQPFIENSIEHGFAGMQAEGLITIDVAVVDKQLHITMSDNGKGIDPKDEKQEHISRAMQITRDRLALLNRQRRTKAGFSVHSNDGSRGVTIHLKLPLMHSKK